MIKNNQFLKHICRVFCITWVLFCAVQSHAQTNRYDDQYLSWKQTHAPAPHANNTNNNDNHYLAKPSLQPSLSKISINRANLEQLQQLVGVGEKKAQAIIAYRQKNGLFKSIDELQNVKGFGEQLLKKNRDRLSL